ncbi:MAG: helix-turn-helix domain-containing protein, partial [Phycisphaerae bacterium]
MSGSYLTACQVAELLQLSVETVYALITREALPATRVGRRWRFDETRVRKWFDERGNQAAKAPGSRPASTTTSIDRKELNTVVQEHLDGRETGTRSGTPS